ncbi:unnamed protein product [Allacma fusca]|uniref:Uncharacterized protein n=1 Tax=Allacma fusca TaxID=39272 RepID=A0A8J2NXB8_9HEXA|nr:unnamed protein product [Allacma fusca]
MSTTKSDLASWKKQDQFVSDDSGNFTASVFTDGDGSHVTMLSPRMDPASSVAGLTEDGCLTSAVSLSDYLTAPSTPRNILEPGDSYLKAIFDNFNELYQDKMSWIDENIPGGDTPAHVMAKKNVLEHWVKDVIEQNNILVQTVEELEVEAEKKVQNLQKKVFEASELAKEHMGMIKEYEEQIKHLMKEKHIVEKQEEFFRKESVYLEKEKRRALDRLHTLENDNSSILALINRIRDMGVWDVNGLNFCPRTYDTIFGLYPNLPGSEVQTVFTREKAKNLEKAENQVAQLLAQVEELHGRKDEAERLLTEKTKVTEELQNDIKDLHIKIKHYQDEHQDFKRSLKETQDQLRAATMKNQSRPSTADTKRESEMKEMLSELRDLRNQLNIACTERQQAMKESNALKMELRGRITQMEDMKLLLEQLQTDAASTRNAVQDVQDKQDQMSSLKEKVTFYQTSYENSNVLLEAKSEIIVKLQNQMDQLHDKVSKLEQTRSCSQSVPARTNIIASTHSPSPTPSLSRHGYQRTSRPASHPNSRAASHVSSNAAQHGQLSSGKKMKTKDVIKKAVVKVKKGSITPKASKTETKNQEANKKHSSCSNKPPWNDHFVRNAKQSTSPRTNNSEKLKTKTPAVSMKYSTQENQLTPAAVTKPSNRTESGVSRIANYDTEKSEEKRVFSDTSKKQGISTSNDGSQPVNRIIADYLNQSDISGKLSSNTDKPNSKQRPMERVKLPPISSKAETNNPQVSPSKLYDKNVDEHLPRIIVKEKKAHIASNIETLETLMEVCVKASRELNRQSDMEGKSAPKYRVLTGHSHRRYNHKNRENTYTVETIPKNKPVAKAENVVAKAVVVTRNENTKTFNKRKASTKPTKPEKSESETLSDISQFRRVQPHPKVATPTYPCERSPESILAELPKESQDYLVKKWIVNSPSPSKKLRKPRSTSPNKSSLYNYSDKLDPDRRGKSKLSGPVNLKMLAMDDWIRKQDLTHSDATGDRDSGTLPLPSYKLRQL